MPLKTEQLDEPALNLTPMIDVVFLLIIFFMVGSHFSEKERENKFDVQVPTVGAAMPLTAPPDQLIINVDEQGNIYLGDDQMSRKQLIQELSSARERYADQSVIIRGAGEGKYQNVADVLSACHLAGIKHFSVATIVKKESP